MNTCKQGQIHRFGDHAAVWLGNGETVYLTQEQALDIAYQLEALAADIAGKKFTESTFKTFAISPIDDITGE